MPMLIGLGAGAGLGALKYAAIDQPQYQREKALASATQRYSPWTGMHATAPAQPNPVSNILSYGSQGGMMGQGMQNAQTAQALQKAQTNWLNQQQNPWMLGPNQYSGIPSGNYA